jgi:hypothetical protein
MIQLSPLQEKLLVLLAKRNGFPNIRKTGQTRDDIWHKVDVTYEVEVCLVCGQEVMNCFAHEDDIYKHGLEHIENSNLKLFL